jgi:hypothetical protein
LPLALLLLLNLHILIFLSTDLSRTYSPVPSSLSCRQGVLVLAPYTLDVADAVEVGEPSPTIPNSLHPLLQDWGCDCPRHLLSGLAAGFLPLSRLDAKVDEAAHSFVLSICISLASDLWLFIASLFAVPYSSCPG